MVVVGIPIQSHNKAAKNLIKIATAKVCSRAGRSVDKIRCGQKSIDVDKRRQHPVYCRRDKIKDGGRDGSTEEGTDRRRDGGRLNSLNAINLEP